MTVKKGLVVAALLVVLAWPVRQLAQQLTYAVYSEFALALSPFHGLSALTPLSYGPVRVCALPLTQQRPCLPLATIYSTVDASPIPVPPVGNFGQLQADVVGHFAFGCVAGTNYWVQVAAAGNNTPQLDHEFTCPSGTNGAVGPGFPPHLTKFTASSVVGNAAATENAAGKTSGYFLDEGGGVFNVASDLYGAKCDGTTDDTAAIQAAATAAGSGQLFFPSGVCRVTSTITLSVNTSVVGAAYGAASVGGTGQTVIKWDAAGNGPVFVETATGINSNNLGTRGGGFQGLTFENTGTATALVGIQLNNVQASYFNQLAMSWTGGTCIQLQSTNANYPSGGGTALWTERTTFGPNISLSCGTDIAMLTSGGTGSFGYTNILGSHLDGHALDIGSGSSLYHSYIQFHSNIGAGATNITVEGGALNNRYDIRSEGTPTCSVFNLADSTQFTGTGIIDVAGCTVGTIGTGAILLVPANAYSDDASAAASNYVGNLSGYLFNTVLGADRIDQTVNGQPLLVQGIAANSPSGQVTGYYLFRNTTNGRACVNMYNGTVLSTATLKSGMCDYAWQLPTANFSNLGSSPWSGAPNGSIVYCTDCNATCTANGGTGRTCFRENGAWTH